MGRYSYLLRKRHRDRTCCHVEESVSRMASVSPCSIFTTPALGLMYFSWRSHWRLAYKRISVSRDKKFLDKKVTNKDKVCLLICFPVSQAKREVLNVFYVSKV